MSLYSVAKSPQKFVGSGISRKAYYSRKHKVIIKKTYDRDTQQSENEITLFKMMTEEEKNVFPMVGYYYFDNMPVVIMRRCYPIENIIEDSMQYDFDNPNDLKYIADIVGADESSVDDLIDFCWKYRITDLHQGNVALDKSNNRLVLIDAGYSRDSNNEEDSSSNSGADYFTFGKES